MNEFRDHGGPPGLPASLAALPWGGVEPFLGIPPDEAPFASSPVVVLPVPYEATVSYMGGTRFGPRGLLHASRFVELYDPMLDAEPWTVGIATLPELVLPGSGPEQALPVLRTAIEGLLDAGKFVILLGGEHSVSGDPILAHADRTDARLSVLQLDAHADLRASYEGTPLSHACVMHRVLDRVDLVPVGIRSLTAEERALMRSHEVPTVWGHEVGRAGWQDRVLDALGDPVYITVDVDYFDPGIMPSTGTPEPGGGAWYPTLELLERVFRERHVVGCDVVELAPHPGVVAPDVMAAELVYKLAAFWATSQANRETEAGA
jgi:agmatinase